MQLTSPLAKGRLRGDISMYFYSIIVALAIFSPFHLFTFLPLACLQIVSLEVVKKSEGTSRECQRNRLTCFQLVKTQGFYGYV